MKLRREFCAKGIQAALGPKFKDLLPESKDETSQTAKQKEAVKRNIGGMGVLIKTNKSEEILVLLNSTVSDDWPWGRVDLAMALLDEMFRPTDTMAKAQQKKKLGELTMKDSEDPHGFGLKIASLELEFNNTLSDEDKMATLICVSGSRYATTICGKKNARWPKMDGRVVRHRTAGIVPSGGSIARAGRRMSAATSSFPLLGRNEEVTIGEAARNRSVPRQLET